MENLEVYVNISVEEFPLICRICLAKGNLKFFKESLVKIFTNLTDIQIEPGDNLPSNICPDCTSKLEDISKFINVSKLNDAGLRRILEIKEQTPSEECEESVDNDVFDDDLNFPVRNMELEDQSVDSDENKINESTLFSDLSDKIEEEISSGTKKINGKKRSLTSAPEKFHCFHCQKTFHTKNKLKVHLIAHSEEGQFECKLCSKKFKFSQNLVRHNNSAHKNLKPFKCEICHKEFARRERKVRHLRTHTVKSESRICYCCKECQKTFNRRMEYRQHMERHHAQNEETRDATDAGVKCHVCEKTFVSKYVLQTHMITHNGKKEFLCNICGKEFLKKVYLDIHAKIHTDEKPFECKVCGKRFRQSSTYKTHLVIHTGERFYKCNQCDKTFKQNNHLKRHHMIHEGIKPHECSFCGKSFAQLGNLKSHMRLHTGETPYPCSICGKKFSNSGNLKKHKKSHGNMKIEEVESKVRNYNL